MKRKSSITSDDLTNQESVQQAIKSLKTDPKFSDKQFSDILDDQGHQYVDFVLEGGGVLGIALAGYTYCLEQAGIRFLGVAGTSAGAINALLIAASDSPDQEKSDTVINQVANVPLSSFVDGNIFARIVFHVAQWKVHWLVKVIVGFVLAFPAIPVFMVKLGLNPGNKFSSWLEEALSAVGINSLSDLESKMAVPKNLTLRESRSELGDGRSFSTSFAVIAADVTTRTKVEFPRMSKLYWENPSKVHPACFVRASMSVPFFFQPFEISSVPKKTELKDDWSDLAGYEGDIPDKVRFVDGGILSNFPIYVFHNYKFVPRAPTFGVRLGIEREKPDSIANVFGLAKAILRSTRHILDYDFITKNQEYKKLISEIDTGNHYWLNFNLSDEAKKDLFAAGVKAAAKFLLEFDWVEYKEMRRRLIQQDS